MNTLRSIFSLTVMAVLTVCAMIISAQAQTDSDFDPGLTQNVLTIPTSEDSGAGPRLVQPLFSPMIQTGPAVAEAITPEIQALAANLGNDPTRIFNFVHDEIRYVCYFGSKKGAALTLLERSGNDFDQCALLSALLQSAGYSPSYQFAMLKMPVSSSDHQDLQHWLGLSFSNTNWLNTTNFFSYLVGTRGFPAWQLFSGDTNTIAFHRIWVTLEIGGTNYYLDPAFKVSEPIAGINLSNAMALNTNTLMTAAGGTDTGSAVSGLNEGSLRTSLTACNSNLISYISNNIPNASPADVIGGQEIVSSSGLPLSTSLLFPLYTNSTYKLLNWTNQPTNFMASFTITFGGTNQTCYMPQLQGQRLSLTFDTNALAQLWLDDSLILQTTNTGPSNTNSLSVILSANLPYGGGWNSATQSPIDGGPLYGFDRSYTNLYQRTNASYAIMYGFEPSPQWLQSRQQKLDAYRAQGLSDSSRQVTTETLNVMGLGWLVQTELAHQLLCQQWAQLPQSQYRFGRMAQEKGKGYYVDVYMQLDGTLPGTGYNSADVVANNQEFDVYSYIGSAMEHGIIEQLQNSNLVAASTVKMLEIANTNSQTVYLANSSNWSTGVKVKTNLVNYGTVTNALENLINNGYVLLLPKNGSNTVAGAGTWAGYGIVELYSSGGSRSMGMIIQGTYHGGYISNPNSTVNSGYISQSGDSQSSFFNPQSPFLPVQTQYGADPVNLSDGSFQISSTDLSIGQREPRGLNFARYYSSSRRNSNPAGMAPGWLHSYYCTAMAVSSPDEGLGTGTVQQMSPMIVATYAALNLYNNVNLDPKSWMVTTLIAKWGVDQLLNNTVAINLGKDAFQFTKQPDNTYTPPENCTMTLRLTNGAYWLQERNDRTFKFGTNHLLTNIVDQYGQSLKLSYNASSLLTNVTDWKSRSLTFRYNGTTLTNVSDSSGRSVSYGYTSGDLTSFTDAEQKTSSYAYDTNHDVVVTYDALGRVVVTNLYDGFGHVTTQLSQGDTNKTWQIFASGFETIEVDPNGGQRTYVYDSRSRPVLFQDALGNITQTFYDGQDHVVQTISPLNETNQYIYDANNNLVETIDPLGFSNLLTFDSKNTLIASTDGRGKVSHFGYNTQFSLIGSTNGNGDWTVLSYNSDGTLASRQNSGGSTTYGYDSFGQLNSITYPSSLGSESFINSSLGDVTSHTDARGFSTTFAYNNRRQLTNTIAPTNLTSKISYDAIGNVATMTDARGFVTSNSWSVTRHQTATVLPTTPQGTPVVTNIYDNRDWLTQTLDPLQHSTSFSYDAAQRLVSTTDPVSRTTTFGYDADGQKLATTNAASETIRQTWDGRGKLITLTDGAGHVSSRVYDAAGNQAALTNRNVKKWQFQFDGANRLTNTITPNGFSSSQSYNDRGLLASSKDAAGQGTTYGYDAKGRLTSRADSIGTTSYGYDANDNRTSVIENGNTNTWTYDAYNRVSTYKDVYGNLIQYRYDTSGNLTNLVYPGGRTVVYFYDSLNRLTNVTDWEGRQTILSYDLASHLTGITRPNGTSRTVNYDAAGQATNIVEKTPVGFPIALFRFNWNNAAEMQWEFTAPTNHSVSLQTRNMVYDDDNRLTSVNGISTTSDSNGNLTYAPLTNGVFTSLGYDARNRLVSAGGITNTYDAANNRVAQSTATSTTYFVVNPNAKLPQVLMRIKGTTTNYYVYGAGLLYQVTETATTTNTATYHYDFRGSTVAITDGSGLITDRIEYSTYGSQTYRLGNSDTPFLFNGRYGVMADPNGLLYMRARYYNPYICRFTSADPTGFNGGLNWFTFANGNPTSLLDPFGLHVSGDSDNSGLLNNNLSYLGVPCIMCHGVSAAGFNGDVNAFAGLTAIPGSGSSATWGYQALVNGSEMAAPLVAGPVGGLIAGSLDAAALSTEAGILTLNGVSQATLASTQNGILLGTVENGEIKLFQATAGEIEGHADLVNAGLVSPGAQGFSIAVQNGQVTAVFQNSILNSPLADYLLHPDTTQQILQAIGANGAKLFP